MSVFRIPAEDFVRGAEDGVYVQLRVSPEAKSTAVKGLYGEGAFRLSIAASPVGGRASAEVERYLAGLFGLDSSEVTVVKSVSSRDKVVFVNGLRPDEIRTPLSTLL